MKTLHETHPSSGANAGRAAITSHADSWFVTTDPRRLSILFAIVIGLALVAGAFLAVGLVARPLGGPGALAREDLQSLYTMHGLVLVFLVATPVIPGVFGHAFLPRRFGFDSMVLPRVGLLAFHLLVTAVVLFAVAAVVAPGRAGWTFDVPFAIEQGSGLWLAGLGVLFSCASTVCAGACVVATVVVGGHARRETGTSVFAWAIAIASGLAVVAALTLSAVVAMLLAERAGMSSVFAAGAAADERFASWFWLAAHAALGAIVVGALGLVTEVVEGARGEPRSADTVSVACLVALALLSFVGFGIHVPGRDVSPFGAVVASALAIASGVPVAVFLARGWSRLADGTVPLTPALCWVIAFAVCLCAGGIAAAALAILPTATYLDHTTYATGVFHLLFAGALLSAVFAGVYHAWRDWSGSEARAGWARFACFLFVVGALATFGSQLAAGWIGASTRGGANLASASSWSLVSALGGVVLGVGLVLTGWNLLQSWIASEGEARG